MLFYNHFVCFLLCLISISASEQTANSTTRERTAKWSLFNIIQFNKEQCEGVDSQIGICVSAKECNRNNGQNIGTCAQGFGVCCVITKSCGETVIENGTYFVNPNYPTETAQLGSCSVKLNKLSSNICQIRLDLEEFSLTGPHLESGRCATDSFVVIGQDLNNVIPPVCGLNDGQHVYIEVGSSSGPLSLISTTSMTTMQLQRKWKIRVTQIECSNFNKAPPLCLQYYTGAINTIKSFNYDMTRENERSYPVNLNYAICIRKEEGMCSVSLISQSEFGVGEMLDNCRDEFLALGSEKYCGNVVFNTEVRTNALGPIVLTFKSDAEHSTRFTGFNLRFSQVPCLAGL